METMEVKIQFAFCTLLMLMNKMLNIKSIGCLSLMSLHLVPKNLSGYLTSE